ncbi:MAG: hypothetical protein U0228_07315 [Myxococcaceae bacterium]
MGKPPREFAGVHVHFESVQRVDGPRYVATVLLQSAFDPPPKASLVLLCLPSARVVVRQHLPSLAEGRVVRASVPLKLEAGELPELGVRVEGPAPRGERVRTAWLLHDTLAAPRSPALFEASALPPAPGEKKFELEQVMRGPLVEGTCAPLSDMRLELLWRPGQAVPRAVENLPRAAVAEERVRLCRTCGFEGPREEYERARECPNCAAPWT